MGLWTKSLQIFNCLCDNGTQSVGWIAQKTGCSKSSVHRLQQAIAQRGRHPEFWLWETEDGRHWFTHLRLETHGGGATSLAPWTQRSWNRCCWSIWTCRRGTFCFELSVTLKRNYLYTEGKDYVLCKKTY
jgi:hypothetical protein